MKKYYFLQLVFMFSVLINVNAKTIRVDNNLDPNPSENLYASVQTAHDAALNGDTILIEGSVYEYGDLSVTKQLFIIGTGFFLDQNPFVNENKNYVALRQVGFSTGSSGSKISGCVFLSNSTSDLVSISVDNITIEGNYFGNRGISITGNALDNIKIKRNYFLSYFMSYKTSINSNPMKNIVVTNNIILGDFNLINGTYGIIINNIFKGSEFQIGSSSNELQIFNNILLSASDSSSSDIVLPSMIGTNLAYNISNGQFGTANNNLSGYYESQIFVETGSVDGKYMIKVGGPADGKGQDGMDIGVFGGPNPYKLSGISNMPVIYDLSTDGYADEEGKISVQMKAKAY